MTTHRNRDMMRRQQERENSRRMPVVTMSAMLVGAVAIGTAAFAQAGTPTARPGVGAAALNAAKPAVPAKPTATYWVYVGAESADLIHRIKFGPGGAVVERTIAAGEMAAETEGPHGLQISRDGKYLHMTTGHGSPDGKYWKYALGPDTLVGEPSSPATFRRRST